jgi:alpha-beta hydrolase superfamily lysophospholipase
MPSLAGVLVWTGTGVGLAGVGLLGLGTLAIAYFSTHPPRKRIRTNPSKFGAEYEAVELPSIDGTALSGWLVPAESPKGALLLAHGMCATRESMLPWAEWLWKEGYTLLMVDFRALGLSEGRLCTMGLHEQDDLRAAVNYLESREETKELPVGVLGFSMGGAAAILAASRDSRIQAIVTHGAFASLDHGIRQRCKKHFGPMGKLIEWPVRVIGQRWFAGASHEVDCVKAVSNIKSVPILLANGRKDRIVPVHNMEAIAAAANEGMEYMVLPNTGHAYPSKRDEEHYREKVIKFFAHGLSRPKPQPAP